MRTGDLERETNQVKELLDALKGDCDFVVSCISVGTEDDKAVQTLPVLAGDVHKALKEFFQTWAENKGRELLRRVAA